MAEDQDKLLDMRAVSAAAAADGDVNPLHQPNAHHHGRHIYLHRALDELVADWILHNMKARGDGLPMRGLRNTSIMELMEWSFQQTQYPTEVDT